MEEIKKEEVVTEENTVDTTSNKTEKTPEKSDNSAEIEKLKRQLSKANSEAADYKRKWQETATEAQKAEDARIKAEQEKDEQLKTLLREKTVSNYSKKFIGIGYDTETSDKLANGLPDGVTDEFFEAQKRFFEQKTAKMTADALNNQPSLSAGAVPQGNTDNNEFLAAMRKATGLT